MLPPRASSTTEPAPLIAIVDDHELSRRAICRLLERHGYATRDFASAADFVRSTEKAKVACLISDVRMPEIDGVSLHECLKLTNYDFPLIFCTGVELDDRLQKALAEGAFALVRKPVNSEVLLQAVATACESGRKRPR